MQESAGCRSNIDMAGAYEFVRNMREVLDNLPDQVYRWVAPGLLAWLIREESDMDHEDESMVRLSQRYAKALVKGHARYTGTIVLLDGGKQVARLTGLTEDTLIECIDQATNEVECTWQETVRLGLKPGKKAEESDEHGRVIMIPRERDGVPVLGKDGKPIFDPKESVLTWAHTVKVDTLPWLDQARKIRGMAPVQFARFGLSDTTIARMLESMYAGAEDRQDKAVREVKTRIIRREKAKNERVVMRSLLHSWEFRQLMNAV